VFWMLVRDEYGVGYLAVICASQVLKRGGVLFCGALLAVPSVHLLCILYGDLCGMRKYPLMLLECNPYMRLRLPSISTFQSIWPLLHSSHTFHAYANKQ